MAWKLQDTDAKNVYNALYRHYAGQQLPDGFGVFFGFENFTQDKLYYCIEALKRYWSLGWYTTDAAARRTALEKIAKILFVDFGNVDFAGIYKFLVWCYTFATKNPDILDYFKGDSYGLIEDVYSNLTNKVKDAASAAAENVSYAITYPSLEKSVNAISNALTPRTVTMVKWGLILGAAWFAWRWIDKKLF